jgi:hypothetical protein
MPAKYESLQRLYDRFYPTHGFTDFYNGGQTTFGRFDGANAATLAAAFQLAVWEIVFGTGLDTGPNAYSADATAMLADLVNSTGYQNWTIYTFTNGSQQDFLTATLRVPEPGSLALAGLALGRAQFRASSPQLTSRSSRQRARDGPFVWANTSAATPRNPTPSGSPLDGKLTICVNLVAFPALRPLGFSVIMVAHPSRCLSPEARTRGWNGTACVPRGPPTDEMPAYPSPSGSICLMRTSPCGMNPNVMMRTAGTAAALLVALSSRRAAPTTTPKNRSHRHERICRRTTSSQRRSRSRTHCRSSLTWPKRVFSSAPSCSSKADASAAEIELRKALAANYRSTWSSRVGNFAARARAKPEGH